MAQRLSGYTDRANTQAVYIRRAGQDREQEVKLSQCVPIKPETALGSLSGFSKTVIL
jgi:hypothetical protein